MGNLGTASSGLNGKHERRSTRIAEAVRLNVTGQSKVGNSFSELTLTRAVNCHGCVYPSRVEPQQGSWVTLEFPNQSNDHKMSPVRALVRFVRAPQNPNEHCEVGVELETPANVWRIASAPEDWHRFPALPESTTATAQGPLHGNGTQVPVNYKPQNPVAPERVVSSSDQLLRALEKNIRLAAEKAVELAVTSRLNPAVNQAITAIDKFSQAGVRQIAEQGTQSKEKVITSAHDDLYRRLQADLAHAEERLKKQLEVSLTEIQEKTQEATNGATSEGHLLLAESVDFLKDTAKALQEEFSTHLRETTDRTAAELSAETVRFSDRQLSLLNKQVQAAIGEGSALLETKAAEARSRLDAAADTLLGDFHQKAAAEIEQASIDVRQDFMSSLTAFADDVRGAWEARQRAWQEEMVRANEQQCQQFRQKLDEILQSSILTAVSSMNEHSTSLLKSLSKKPAEDTKEAPHGSG